MKSDSWTHISSSSNPCESPSGAPAEEYLGSLEDMLGELEYLCPFCPENFDIVGLCCHIDVEHAIEAKDGVCRVCAQRVGLYLIDHVIRTHKNLSKCKKRSEKGESNALLRKEQMNENSHLFCEGSSSNLQLDPLLSLFNKFLAVVHEPCVVEPLSSDDKSSNEEQSKDNTTDRRSKMFASSSNKDEEEEEEEKARKGEFVQRLILSTLLDERTVPSCSSSHGARNLETDGLN